MKKILFTILIYFNIIFGMSILGEKIVDDDTQLKLKVAIATRIANPPIIDGDLSDRAWENAKIITEFVQHEPFNLEAPTVKNVARVLYDDNYLYIAFDNFDPNPENIMARRSRRDDWGAGFGNNSDWVGIGIDSRNDDKSGYWFAVNAAEVQLDVAISGSGGHGGFDNSWNAVWDSEVLFNDNGWTVEIRLPFNIFEYSSSKVQEWGASFQRGYYNNQEEIHWPGRALGVRGIVPHYGVLQGIEGIPQPKNIEFVPYLLSGQTNSNETEKIQNVGMDVRYNLNSSNMLNMSFNPDFGQVEADPSVLNLSAFETRLSEKRPFFVQGANFFKSRFNLFNSRRIGRAPGFYAPESGSIVDKPEATTILGSAKLMGKSASGLRYGIINAVTNEEYGLLEYEEDGNLKKKKFLLEPFTNYFVGRVEKPIINELSTVGFMATDLRRKGETNQSRVFNLDWRLNFMDNRLSFEGQAVNSLASNKSGYGGRFIFTYRNPVWWEIRSWGQSVDKNFNVNDMGFQERNNNWYGGFHLGIRRDYPKGYFLNQRLSLKASTGGLNGIGLITRKNIEIEQNNNFINYWGLGWSLEFNPETFEDDDTYRDSRAVIIKDEGRQSFDLWFRTDRRKRLILRPQFNISRGVIRGVGKEYGLELILKPTDNINFSVKTSKEDRPESMQWVGIVEDENGVNIIYSNIKREQTNTELRLDIAFSSKMTFEAYYQPFSVKMDYTDYNRLEEEKSLKVSPYPYTGNKNFKIDNQVGTFVFRWEYLPGSLFYAVYNLNDNSYYSAEDSEWSNSKSNSLFLKFDYFFQL